MYASRRDQIGKNSTLLNSARRSGPTGGKPIRGHRRHATNVDVKREQSVLNVKLPEDLCHLFDQKGSPYPPLSDVLVIHFVR